MIFSIYGIVTLLLIVGFIILCVWAYHPKQDEKFSAYAALPFAEEIQATHHSMSSARIKGVSHHE